MNGQAEMDEIIRLRENELFKAWEQGWFAGRRDILNPEPPDSPWIKNPYQFHAKDADEAITVTVKPPTDKEDKK